MSKTSDKTTKTTSDAEDYIGFIRQTSPTSGIWDNFKMKTSLLTGRNPINKIVIPSADLLTCRATPYQFIDDPTGAKDYIRVKSITAYILFNSAAYAGGSNLDIRFAGGGTTIATLTAGFIQAAATDAQSPILAAIPSVPPITGIEVFNTGGAEYTTGDSDLTIYMEYEIIDFS